MSLAAAFSDQAGYIRDKKLNDIESPDDPSWDDHDEYPGEKAVAILKGFSEIDGIAFCAACGRSFEVAKIVMTFYRYIRDLVNFEKNGLVRFPQAE